MGEQLLREAFERTMRADPHYWVNRDFDRDAIDPDKYDSRATQAAWHAWQAALAQPAEGGEPIAEVHASWDDDEGFMIVRRLAERLPVGTKLYTTPPASKPADGGEVGITALEAIANGDLGGLRYNSSLDAIIERMQAIARAALAAAKTKKGEPTCTHGTQNTLQPLQDAEKQAGTQPHGCGFVAQRGQGGCTEAASYRDENDMPTEMAVLRREWLAMRHALSYRPAPPASQEHLHSLNTLEQERQTQWRLGYEAGKKSSQEQAQQPGVTVRYDLTPAMVEGTIRDKLIELGWTPPTSKQPQSFRVCNRCDTPGACREHGTGQFCPEQPQAQAQELPDERVAFEAWAKKHSAKIGKDIDGDYLNLGTQCAWLSWQARAALAAKQERKPMTDEQIRSMCKQSWVFETVKQWVRIIEAHHGILEKGVEG